MDILFLGVHPESRMFVDTMTHLIWLESTSANEIQNIQAQVTELQNGIRTREQERQEMQANLRRLMEYHTRSGGTENRRGSASQPESEP